MGEDGQQLPRGWQLGRCAKVRMSRQDDLVAHRLRTAQHIDRIRVMMTADSIEGVVKQNELGHLKWRNSREFRSEHKEVEKNGGARSLGSPASRPTVLFRATRSISKLAHDRAQRLRDQRFLSFRE